MDRRTAARPGHPRQAAATPPPHDQPHPAHLTDSPPAIHRRTTTTPENPLATPAGRSFLQPLLTTSAVRYASCRASDSSQHRIHPCLAGIWQTALTITSDGASRNRAESLPGGRRDASERAGRGDKLTRAPTRRQEQTGGAVNTLQLADHPAVILPRAATGAATTAARGVRFPLRSPRCAEVAEALARDRRRSRVALIFHLGILRSPGLAK
jgi:hypothetical protein